MNCHEAYAEEINRCMWADPNPDRCGCKGHGLWVSGFDSWHECPFHSHPDLPHPEWDEETHGPCTFDWDAHERRVCVVAYRQFRDEGGELGVTPELFEALCRRELGAGDHTPREWVNAANGLVDELRHTLEEANARAEGYCCALERRWAVDGQAEAMGWGID